MITSMRDVVLAQDEGRYHSQRFIKNAGTIGDSQWQDWSFASGQPAFDARIGAALAFNPFVAQRNDAIYFPPKLLGQERKLFEIDCVTTAGGSGQISVDFAIYDLLGVYPLIDGDSTDVQPMDNERVLPRFATGEGVMAVLVNHVAPVVTASDMIVNYTSSKGQVHSVTWRATANGQNKVCYTTAGVGTSGPLYCGLASGDTGIISINDIQFTTAPGGLWAIYLCKPLANFANVSQGLSVTTERNFLLSNGFKAPTIEDGAWLGMFYMPNGGARTVAMHGNMHFVWG